MSATIINKMLVKAVYENDLCRVNDLLLLGANPNYTYKRNGVSGNLIRVCLQYKFIEILRALLNYGATTSTTMKRDLLSEVSHKEKELIALIESIKPIKSQLANSKFKLSEYV
jgi:hypothetical protein